MVAAWPSQVRHNQSRRSAAIIALRQPPLINEAEGGGQIMRPRPGPQMTKIAWQSLEWDENEYTAFEQFFENSLIKGVMPFNMPVYKPAHGYVMRICQIESAQFSVDESRAPYFTVSFTLVVWDY